MEMRKILVISNMYPSEEWPHYGVFVKNSVELLRNEGYAVDVVYVNKTTNSLKKLYSYMRFYIFSTAKGIFCHYDAIYGHYASHTALPLLVIKKFKKNVPLVMNVHGNDVVPETDRDKRYLKLVRSVLSASDKIISPSEYFKNVLLEKYYISEEKIVVYPSGGVDTNKFRKMEKAKALSYLNLDQSCKYIGYVSRIEKNKGWELFLRAGKRILEQYPYFRLIVVGDGEQSEQYTKVLNELEIETKVTKYSLMAQDELTYVYNALDIFVFPTYRKSESLGLVGLEAMACEDVVVASDKYGPSSYVANGKNGFTFESENEESLYYSLLTAIEVDPVKKKSIVSNARKTAEKYSRESTRNILLNLFEEIIR